MPSAPLLPAAVSPFPFAPVSLPVVLPAMLSESLLFFALLVQAVAVHIKESTRPSVRSLRAPVITVVFFIINLLPVLWAIHLFHSGTVGK